MKGICHNHPDFYLHVISCISKSDAHNYMLGSFQRIICKYKQCDSEVVNVMCQFDWFMVMPGYLVKYYFWVSLWVCFTQISILIARFRKADLPLQFGWASSTGGRIQQKAEEYRLCPLIWLNWDLSSALSPGFTVSFSFFVIWPQIKSEHKFSWVFSLQKAGWS